MRRCNGLGTVAAWWLPAAILLGCSGPLGGGKSGSGDHPPLVADDETSSPGGSTGGNGTGGAGGNGSGQVPGATASGVIITTQVEMDGGATSCGADSYQAERVGVNLYLLIDVSGSMLVPIGVTADGNDLVSRWDAVSLAIKDFIGSKTSDGLELALGYYPIHGERTVCEAPVMACGDGYDCIQTVCDISLGIFGITQPCTATRDLDDDDCLQDIALADGTVAREGCVEPGGCSGDPTRLCFLDDNCAPGDTCSPAAVAICPGPSSCNLADYATPAVPRTALPAGANVMLASIDATEPDSFSVTPTHVALRGAYATVASWIGADADRRSVVVLATDGDPNGCATVDDFGRETPELDDTVDSLAQAAADGIQTFVIGVLDPENPDLQPGETDYVAEARAKLTLMAEAGGAGEATLVTSDDTTATRFLEALDKIRGSVLPCEFKIPARDVGSNPGKLNVEVTEDGAKSVIPKVESEAKCGTEAGWYYNTDGGGMSGSPSKVVLCPSSCAALGSEAGTTVDILLGCNTVIAQQT